MPHIAHLGLRLLLDAVWGVAVIVPAYALTKRAATALFTTGRYTELEEALDFATINNLFAPGRS